MNPLVEKLRTLIQSKKISFEEIDHSAAPTCEASALARKRDIKIGGKTLLLKDKKDFRLFTISAAKQVDSNKVRKILNSQKLRFATKDELQELCGVGKGALPPFGRNIFPYDFYLDKSILDNTEIAFNAGILTKSFILKMEDYLKLIDPIICDFSKE